MKIQEINKLGKELELYTFVDYIGKGFPIILPKGARIIRLIRNEVEYLEENKGYKIVRTPSISNSEIYKIEDRYELEKDELFIINAEEKDENYEPINAKVLKPYVAPFHCSIYKMNQHSYKELPIKYCETSTVFRNEKDIKGITKVRQFTLSDASVFCEPDKLEKSIKESLEIQKELIDKMNLKTKFEIATWDDERKEDYIGNIDEWENATNAMKEVLDILNIKYIVTKKAKMYGPGINVYYNNEEFSSLQIDFEITHRFDIKYTSKENEEKFPLYLHNTIIGSYENLLSILIEKYNGRFPLWLAPVQACIIAENEEYDEYAEQIRNTLIENKIRANIDNSATSKKNKIEKNINLNIPYIIMIGKNELNKKTIKVYENKKKIENKNKEENEIYNEKDCINYNIDNFIKEVINCQTKY